MQNITQRIEVLPSIFFANKNIAYNANEEYYSQWKALYNRAKSNLNSFADNCKWSDFAAMRNIMRNISNQGTNLQISNGSSIRYADLLGVSPDFNGTVHCNRGVSGIDGSTSTALGASLANNTSTILITGDMSFSYDINGLASLYNSKQFKIIVLCNGGGGIFRFINGPSNLPDFEQYFEVNRDLQIDKFAHAFGFDYFKANSKQELEEVLPIFLNNNKESILAVFTNNEVSAQTLKEYYNRNK
jgi:2-succinyl-5-enolpyruvyl-6-hydroxy-3-cyclohexene-1-carboxylate synthase